MSQIQQVKEATDIVQLLGERLQVQRSGSSYRALCPFHSEKSPSFFINEQFQRYKCFGCGESGDVLTFLQKYDGMTFAEALRYLADRAGIQLESYQTTPEDELRDQVLAILNLTKEYYHYLLTQHEVGEKARQYLKERGVTQESIKLFQLGYALPSWDGLITYLKDKKKYKLDLIEKAGLIIQGKGGRFYDRFRDRIMFPLNNHRGQVVGFSGRVLDKDTKEAKYINSPETMLYHKSQMLYGFSELFQEIRKKKEVVVVEGEFDVISSAQAHVNHVVAIKGSAMTAEHLKLLGRVAERVLLSLDADSAGVEATKRAIELARETNLELRVVSIVAESIDGQPPKKQDPDDLARTNPKAWREAVKSSVSVYEFLLRSTLAKYDPATPEGKRQIMTELAPVLNSIPLVVEQDVYIRKLAQALDVKEELVRTDMRKLSHKRALGRQKTKPETKTAATQPETLAPQTRREKLEWYVLFLLFHHPEAKVPATASQVPAITWSTPGAKQLVDRAAQWSEPFTIQRFAAELPEDLNKLLFTMHLNPEYVSMMETLDLAKEWTAKLKDLQAEAVKDQVTELENELNRLDRVETKTPEQEARQTEILQEMVALQRTVAR